MFFFGNNRGSINYQVFVGGVSKLDSNVAVNCSLFGLVI